MNNDPPCDKCNGACCKGFHEYAVMLDEDENYPDAVDFQEHPDHTIKVIPYENQRCIYLNAQDRCSIYENRPKRCREFNCVELYAETPKCFFFDDLPQLVELLIKENKA